MNRIVIIGPSGAGKSTLARRVAEVVGLEVIHLDRVHWRPGWVEPPDEEFEADLREAIAQRDRWIVDGNYARKQRITLPVADTVVWLDFPRYLCMWRIVRRVLQYSGISRPDLPSGCPEQPDWEFTKWVWNFQRDERPKILKQLSSLRPDQRVVVLRNPKEVEAFVRSLEDDKVTT